MLHLHDSRSRRMVGLQGWLNMTRKQEVNWAAHPVRYLEHRSVEPGSTSRRVQARQAQNYTDFKGAGLGHNLPQEGRD